MNETETLIEEIKNHMIWLISTIEPVKGVEDLEFELNWIDVLKSIRTKKLLKIESISNNI